MAVAAALGLSAGAGAAVVPGTVKKVDKKTEQRWRRDYVAARILRWQGVGMLSRGPRWPLRTFLRKVRAKVVAADGTRYLQLTTGELVRFPVKVHHTRPMRKQIKAARKEFLLGQTA